MLNEEAFSEPEIVRMFMRAMVVGEECVCRRQTYDNRVLQHALCPSPRVLPTIGTISVVVIQRLLECAIPEDEAKCSLASVATEEW